MASIPDRASEPIRRLLSGDPALGDTHALLVVRRGEVVIEHYADGIDAGSTLRSWSMAKSVLHAAVGVLVDEGALELDQPAPVSGWTAPGDPRGAITLRHLMTMRSGLSWREEPEPGRRSDAVDLVYGVEGRAQPDTAEWAADRPLETPPGAAFRYSSGTSAIVAGILRDTLGSGEATNVWLRERLFDPLAIRSPRLRFDEAGTWIASSFCFATARDFARFGELYLAEGMWAGQRVISSSWVATARTETGRDDLGRVHTCHWWIFGGVEGAFFASGFRGQYLIVVPDLDLVLVRLGDTATELRGNVEHELRTVIGSLVT